MWQGFPPLNIILFSSVFKIKIDGGHIDFQIFADFNVTGFTSFKTLDVTSHFLSQMSTGKGGGIAWL